MEENFTDAEIEELIVGARCQDKMFELGKLDNDDSKN